MNTRLIAAPLLALLSAAGLCAQAQKFAVVDMQAVMSGTIEGKKANAELARIYKPKDDDFQKRTQDVQAKTDQLKKAQNTMSDAAKAKAQEDIQIMTAALQQDSEDAQNDFDQDQEKIFRPIGDKVVKVLEKYATDKGISMVFNASGSPNNLIHVSAAIDITRDIIAAYDVANPGTAPAAAAPAVPARTPAATTTTPRPNTPAAPRAPTGATRPPAAK